MLLMSLFDMGRMFRYLRFSYLLLSLCKLDLYAAMVTFATQSVLFLKGETLVGTRETRLTSST
jgi:hypothetical protein